MCRAGQTWQFRDWVDTNIVPLSYVEQPSAHTHLWNFADELTHQANEIFVVTQLSSNRWAPLFCDYRL